MSRGAGMVTKCPNCGTKFAGPGFGDRGLFCTPMCVDEYAARGGRS